MKAIRIHEHGGPQVLRYEDAPTPEPGPGQVRLKVQAAGVNFIDVYHRMGRYSVALPFTPGMEAAGTVDALGPDVGDFQVGDRGVYAMQAGAYAEYALVPADRLVRVPAGLELELAAAVMLQGLTAHYLCHSTYPLQPGETALVHAAAGGVGLLLVQVARRCGARVIGTVSTEEKARLAQGYGAQEVIRYDLVDFEAETRRLTGGRGVDVVYDSVGADTFQRSMRCLRPRGYLVLYGQSSGPAEPLDPQELNRRGSLFLTRPSLGHYLADRDELLGRAGDLFKWITAGELRVHIDRAMPLAEAAAAHAYLEGRGTRGKVLLLP